MKQKPILGTKLVPSIENIEGCFRYGGRWEHEKKICYENLVSSSRSGLIRKIEHYNGCTAPIKGINICWDSQRLATRRSPDINYVDSIPFVDFILSATGDVIHSEKLPLSTSPITKAKKLAVSLYTGFNQKFKERTPRKVVCCNPRGKIISCNQPNAIITFDGKNITAIAHNYRNKFGDRVISNLLPVKREYTEGHPDETKGTKFGYLDKIPALQSEENEDIFFGIYDKYQKEKTTKQLNLKGENVPDYMVMKEKFVPSVETPAECFKWGGMWDKADGLCLNRRRWGTAPIKGVECGWSTYETECYNPDHEKNEEEEYVECHRPVVTCRMLDENEETMYDEEHFAYDTEYSDYFRDDYGNSYDYLDYPKERDDAYDTAQSHGREVAKDILRGNADVWGMNYYNTKGEPCDWDDPNAVAAKNPDDVVNIYKKKRGFKPEEAELPFKKIISHELRNQKKLIEF